MRKRKLKKGNNNKSSEISLTRGDRLRFCRNRKGLTQAQLGEAATFTSNYISMMENGKRPIERENAELFARILQVSPAYIMCETEDIMGRKHNDIEYDQYSNADSLFIGYLLAMGFQIVFFVVRLFDGKEIEKIEINELGFSWPNFESVETAVDIKSLKDFCLSDYHCKVALGDTVSEAVITNVGINGVKISFGDFVYTVNRIYDYVSFTFGKINDFQVDRDNTNTIDSLAKDEISRSKGGKDSMRKEFLIALQRQGGSRKYNTSDFFGESSDDGKAAAENIL